MSTLESFTVTMPKYEGPFDLILDAIRDKRIEIHEISLSQITSEFMNYLHKLPKLDLNQASDFLAMAALLIEMKSKRLLPQPEEIELKQSEEEIESELLKHLEEYKVYQSMAAQLKEKKDEFGRVYSRYHREVLQPEEKDFFLTEVSLKDLVEAFQRVYRQIAEEEKVREIKDEEITLPQRIEEVLIILNSSQGLVNFERLFTRRTRIEVVVTFLAILELAKQKKIRILQDSVFGGICIGSKED